MYKAVILLCLLSTVIAIKEIIVGKFLVKMERKFEHFVQFFFPSMIFLENYLVRNSAARKISGSVRSFLFVVEFYKFYFCKYTQEV